MQKIEHIGIAVDDIDKSNALFSKIFGKENFKSEVVESEGVVTSFFKIGESNETEFKDEYSSLFNNTLIASSKLC